MAMYEELGYCPSNAFLQYSIHYLVPANGRCSMELLGDRIGYMVYLKHRVRYEGWPNVVVLFEGDDTLLPIEVATTLAEFIPVCQYGKSGKKIEVEDIINPLQIEGIRRTNEGKFVGGNGLVVFENPNFIVGLKNGEDKVKMWIFQRQLN